MKAIISVSNKKGLISFARNLQKISVSIYSTGGTLKHLQSHGIDASPISTLTNYDEILDGRVKTIHPIIFGGILAKKNNPQHLAELKNNEIPLIDIVVINLYPFEKTIAKKNHSMDEAIENIDVGGPSLLRAAAKNFLHVLPICDPIDYDSIASHLAAGQVSPSIRQQLASKAFYLLSKYDSKIASYFSEKETVPENMSISLSKINDLQYGENPGTKGGLYSFESLGGISNATKLSGPTMSYNNFLDANAAWACVSSFSEIAVSIIKHTNPCGMALHPNPLKAFLDALSGDPVSSFGGIVAINSPVTISVAKEIVKHFFTVLISTKYENGSMEILEKKKSLRVLKSNLFKSNDFEFRTIQGGVLVSSKDLSFQPNKWETVTDKSPSPSLLESLKFAWTVCKQVKSNAIVLANNKKLVGMGAGQPNRLASIKLAIETAGKNTRGSVLASDAFFPFEDNILACKEAGIAAVVQPGGSVRDKECINAANKFGIPMVFTNQRAFLH